MTISSTVASGMTTSGEVQVLGEAALTVSGTTCLENGVQDEARAVALGADHPVAEAMAAVVHYTDHGAMAEEARVGHGAALLVAATAEVLLEKATMEEAEVALAALA